MSCVGLANIQNNTLKSMKQSIDNSLDLINYSFRKEIKNVVIKPNLCYYWDYSTGQTTDPRFVAALIDLIYEKTSHDIDISVVESDASAMKCRHAFRMLGYERVFHNHNVKLVDLSEDKSNVVDVAAGGISFHLEEPQTIRDADLKINIPKIKYTMEKLKITCALKNIFGCNPYPKKFKYHRILEEAIVAANKAMRFDLCLIDGNVVSGIRPRRLGLVMASEDPVAIDAAASQIAGLNPNTIRYIKLAEREGLGNTSFTPKGMPLGHFKARYPRKDAHMKLMAKAYNLVIRLRLGRRLGLD